MNLLNYEFSNKEDRETAFNNIVKWYGPLVATKVDFLEITIEATQDAVTEIREIAEKHFGTLKAVATGKN